MSFYKVSFKYGAEWRVAESVDGERFEITGDSSMHHRDTFAEIVRLDIEVATYCTGNTEVMIGDRVSTIGGEHTGIVKEIFRPCKVFQYGRVILSGSSKIFASSAVYKL